MLVINTNKVMTQCTRDSLQDACRRWECDYTEITEHDSPYHGASIKLLAFHIVPHDRIFIIDSDTVIRSDAPNIFEITDPSKFYACKNQQPHYPGAYNANTQIAAEEIARLVAAKNLDPSTFDGPWIAENFFNSGVCVVSREHHADIYNLAYSLFLDSPMGWWDQIPLNVAVNMNGGYENIGSVWNYQFPPRQGPMMAYIYHFAGDPTRYETLKNVQWIALDPKVTDREQLHVLINEMGLKVGVELGTQKGLYSEYLLRTTELYLYMIDAWRYIEGYNDIANVPNNMHSENLSETKHRMQPYIGRWKIIREFSVLASEHFEDNSLDFIYVDADHSYSGTTLDLKAWYPKVRSGGLVVGHDFLDGENICGSEFGVRSAVFDFLEDKTHTLYITSGPWPTWWFVK